MIKTIIADDHPIFLDGLESVLSTLSDIHIVGKAHGGRELVELVHKYHPGLVFTDIKMPDMDGIEACKQIKSAFPGITVVALTMHEDEFIVEKMFSAGASGYVLKHTTRRDEIESVVKTVMNGEKYFVDSASYELVNKVLNLETGKPNQFSPRELQIIIFLGEDKTAREIADILHLSTRTVEVHKQRIMDKIGVNSSSGIVAYALRNKLI